MSGRSLEVALLYEAGLSLRALGRRYGVSFQAIEQQLHRAGVELRKRGRPPVASDGMASLRLRVLVEVADILTDWSVSRIWMALFQGHQQPAGQWREPERLRVTAEEEIVTLARAGFNSRQIEALTGHSANHQGAALARARRRGVQVPYARKGWPRLEGQA